MGRRQRKGDHMSAPVYVRAFGEIKSLHAWSRDPRCKVTYMALVQRIQRFGYEPERAITSPKKQGFFGKKALAAAPKVGRKPKYTDAQRALVLKLKVAGLTVREIAEDMDVPSTFVQEVLSPRKGARA